MKLEISTVVMAAATIALAAPLACAAGASAGECFAPYCEDYTRGEPILPAKPKTIEHAKPVVVVSPQPTRKKTERTAQRSTQSTFRTPRP